MQSHCLRRYLLLAIFAVTALSSGPGAQAQTWAQAGMLKVQAQSKHRFRHLRASINGMQLPTGCGSGPGL